MKNLFFILLLISVKSFAQPGDTFINLNDGIGDYIIIDSTTNLNKIKSLKEMKRLNLILNLKEIPAQFKNFDNTEILIINAHLEKFKDLTGISYFKNIKELYVIEYFGEKLSSKKIELNSLKILDIRSANNLNNIDALVNLPLLESLIIKSAPNVKEFPRFKNNNQIKFLEIDYENHRRVGDDDNYLDNIKYLTILTSLTLNNMKEIDKIPDFLPQSVSYLEINGWAQHHWDGEKVEINDLANIKLYPNLKELKLYDVHINCANQKKLNFSLDKLDLSRVHVKDDISWIYSFDTIINLKINYAYDLITIDPKESSTIISSILIEDLPELQTVEFLKFKNTNNLVIKKVPKLELPDLSFMDSIPNIWIFDQKYHLFKVDGKWKKKEYY